MPRIYVLSGPDVGKHFEVRVGTTLGRSAECEVPLRDASVSRLHARIELGTNGLEIVDTGSRNGVKVEGRKVPRAGLIDGIEFEVGEVLLRFRADASPKAAAATEAFAPRAAHASPPGEIRSVPPPAHAEPDLGAEIELEGEWHEPVPSTPARPARPTAHDDGVHSPAAPARRTSAPSPAAAREPSPPLERAGDRSAERIAALGARASAVPAKASVDPTSNRAVLQYHRVDQKEGLLGSDLAQQPVWIKLLAVIVVLALFAGIFWLAFRGTALLRGDGEDPLPQDSPQDR